MADSMVAGTEITSAQRRIRHLASQDVVLGLPFLRLLLLLNHLELQQQSLLLDELIDLVQQRQLAQLAPLLAR